MDKRDIFVKMASIEERIGELYQEIGELKNVIVALIEENGQLIVENEHLRNRLEPKKQASPTKTKVEKQSTKKPQKQVVGEGYDNLARLYAEGFHICNIHYGSLRTEGDCLFCLSFLTGSTHK
ncbi:DNA replication initiation control protein YabA [Brevibacillus ginsengisoli]|uniref:DNA replication initiation control protein YabA n=1 Tax=Brevibacillus ginsengisoli TaxID=363854 RepID=UPI003CF1D9F3